MRKINNVSNNNVTMNINYFQRASSQGTSGKHSLDKSNSSVDNKSGGEMNGKNSLARDQSVTSIASTGLAVMRSKVGQKRNEWQK